VKAAKVTARRCAIYTRKSSEEGLEQDFNSLHAQREACEAFIKSQTGEGWCLVSTAYDDGGLSGGSMERPALRRLLDDIRGSKVDTVVVYKVDRLTRSLADFAKMVEVFDAHSVSFVAVTQQFNTTTSMGRLTLNILLSFAQFEREVTGERIRDKIAASKRKGMWMGGYPSLGYKVQDRKLVVVPHEAETVRIIFLRYQALGCVRRLQQELHAKGILSKIRIAVDGSQSGGKPFSRGALYALLANPIYIGHIRHKDSCHAGQHEAILDRTQFNAVQQQLRDNAADHKRKGMKTGPSLLTGKLFDEAGDPLTPSHAVKNGRRYRYYVSRRLLTEISRDAPHAWRLPAGELESSVIAAAGQMLRDQGALVDVLRKASVAAAMIPSILKAIDGTERLFPLIERVEIRADGIVIVLSLRSFIPKESEMQPVASLCMTRHIPMLMKRRGVEMRLVINGATPPSSAADPALVKAVARAYRWFEDLSSGRMASTAEIAAREGIRARYVRRILPLAFLAPDIIEAIANGQQPVDLTAHRLTQLETPATDWVAQRQSFGFV
jgi:DNA invertase Pin-like site-specific DNA recombinase